jgi:hypothetical protein
MNVRALLLTAIFLAASRPVKLYSQAVGSIVGLVVDQAEAVLPNAKVTAVEKGTQFTRTATTSNAGTYTLSLLPVGTYSVRVEALGFQPKSVDVTLDVEQRREVNFILAVSGVETRVEVTGVAPTINTTTGTLGGLVNERQVVSLPLNGREITNLMLLQPGMQIETNSSGTFRDRATSGNGNRGTSGAGYMDGIDITNDELGGATFSNFNLDAIAEFRILQNNYSAEHGRGGGTIVEMVTKSGTNRPRGSLFEFVRNDVFDARNFFATSKPPFRRNEYGGAVGGPVWIPGVYNGKDKTFFFFQAASFRQRRADPVLFPVLTADERKGLVNITGRDGRPDQLRVPVAPEIAAILNKYPLPNSPGGSFGARTFLSTFSAPIDRDQYSARIDHRFSDKDSVFGRFSFSNNRIPITDVAAAALNPSFSNSRRSDWRNAGLTETHLFSGTLINQFRIGVTQTDEFNIPNLFDQTQSKFADGALQTYGTTGGGFDLKPLTLMYSDGVSWTKGRHTMNFGAEFRRVHASYFGSSVGGPNGFYQFASGTPLPVAIPSASGLNDLQPGSPSPNSLVSFMTGRSQFYQRSTSYPGFGPNGGGFAPFTMQRWHFNGWLQDDFRVTRSLTLNLGVRYEYNSVPVEVAGRLAGIVDSPAFLGPALFGQMVLNPSPIYQEDYRGWGPRVGFAWKAAPKTVLRGGFGIFTNMPLTQTADQQGFNFPFSGTSATPNLDFKLAPQPVSLPPIRELKGNIVPQNGDTHTIAPNTPVDLRPFGPLLTNLTTTNFQNGYTMSGNLTVEHELPFDTVLQVGYVMNNAVKLYASQWPNAYVGADPSLTPYSFTSPGLGEFQLTDNHAHSTYHSLQAVFRKQSPRAGLTFQTSYTYSKAIDNATTVFNSGGFAANSAQLQNDPTCWSCEKGRASFDFPQRVVVNFTYQPPLDRAAPLLPKRLSQGWMFLGIISDQSGFPFTITSPYGTKRYGVDQYSGVQVTRPNLIQNPTLKAPGQGPDEQFFSTEVINDARTFGQKFFSVPLDKLADGTTVQAAPGNLGRNTFRTAGFSNVDFSIIKDTRFTEQIQLQFRGEFFNLLNQHAFRVPVFRLAAPGFGVASSTVFDSRELQFGLRLVF